MMPGRHRRGVWVWQPVPAENLVAYAVAHQVGDLFLSTPLHLDARHRQWLLDVAEAAQGRGIGLYALGGDPGWCDEPQTAVRWQRAALQVGIFARIHLDVEFWLLPAWHSDPARTAGRFLALLDQLEEGGAVDCDIPWWLHRYRTTDGVPLDQAVLGRVALATAMTYRRTVTGENGLLDIARPVLAAAREMGTSVRLAVDTTPPAPGEEHTSFYRHPAPDLARALDEVDATLVFDEAYAGIAVHDLAGWRGLTGSASG